MTLPGILGELFSSRFTPVGDSSVWTPGLVWLHVLSDGLVALSFVAVAFALVVGYAVSRRRRDLPLGGMLLLFAVLLVAFGLAHAMAVFTIWTGSVWLWGTGVVKAATALLSVPAAILLVTQWRHAMAQPDARRGRAALDGSPDAFFILEVVRDESGLPDFVVGDTNARGERLCGRGRADLIGQSIADLLPAELTPSVMARCVLVGDSAEALDEELQVGEEWWELRIVPLEDGLAVTLRDITTRTAAERALRESESRARALLDATVRDSGERNRTEKARARLAAIVESTAYAVYSRALDGTIDTWNAGAERLYGYTGAEIIGKPATLLVPRHVADDIDGAGERRLERAETIRQHKSGNVVEVALIVSPIQDDGDLVGHAVIARDISDQKTAERQLKASLREKEVLLKEIHHRVKNNLQVISSLLNLQAANISDPAALGMFRESQDRVRSIAFFHEHLYQSEDLARVDVAAYLKTLADNLLASYASSRRGVTTRVHADEDVRLGVDMAIPCGLIVNELVTNALKHGFREGQRGAITVDLRASSQRDLVLEVADDGVGLPPGYAVGQARTLGHQLVMTLVKQLNGRLAVDSGAGARFLITFGRQLSGDYRVVDHHR